ncbi:MAG: hypothetical protein JST12_17250 [Armatimonadetes bacterium]|nr:hypothetical protein [Armatimonadota bacterium]
MNAPVADDPRAFQMPFRDSMEMTYVVFIFMFGLMTIRALAEALGRLSRHDFAARNVGAILLPLCFTCIFIWAKHLSKKQKISFEDGTYQLPNEDQTSSLAELKKITIMTPIRHQDRREVKLTLANHKAVYVRPTPQDLERFVQYLESQTGLTAERP